jgi:predicted HTH transcriptional regulator
MHDPAKISKAIQRRLAELTKLRVGTEATERKIREAKQQAEQQSAESAEKLRTRAHLDDEAADRYLDATLDKGILRR